VPGDTLQLNDPAFVPSELEVQRVYGFRSLRGPIKPGESGVMVKHPARIKRALDGIFQFTERSLSACQCVKPRSA